MNQLHTGGCHFGHTRFQFSGPLQDLDEHLPGEPEETL